jgi:predicted lipoprotein with Yx(FWY)xxD motif
MKSSAIAYAVLFLTAASAFAAEPAKTMDTSAGKVYTDDKGMTLYIFDKDEANKSNCYGECAAAWPPLMAAADAQPEGEWTIVERTDGTRMWAYEGKPVYTYAKDTKPGDVTGDGVGGVWHVSKAD